MAPIKKLGERIMTKQSIGEKIVTVSAILAVALAALILTWEIVITKGAFFIVDFHGLGLCASLLGLGIMGRKFVDACMYARDLRLTYPLTCGGIAAFLSSTYVIRRISLFLLIPTVSGFLYILTLPVSVLFLVGVLLRGKPGQQS